MKKVRTRCLIRIAVLTGAGLLALIVPSQAKASETGTFATWGLVQYGNGTFYVEDNRYVVELEYEQGSVTRYAWNDSSYCTNSGHLLPGGVQYDHYHTENMGYMSDPYHEDVVISADECYYYYEAIFCNHGFVQEAQNPQIVVQNIPYSSDCYVGELDRVESASTGGYVSFDTNCFGYALGSDGFYSYATHTEPDVGGMGAGRVLLALYASPTSSIVYGSRLMCIPIYEHVNRIFLDPSDEGIAELMFKDGDSQVFTYFYDIDSPKPSGQDFDAKLLAGQTPIYFSSK